MGNILLCPELHYTVFRVQHFWSVIFGFDLLLYQQNLELFPRLYCFLNFILLYCIYQRIPFPIVDSSVTSTWASFFVVGKKSVPLNILPHFQKNVCVSSLTPPSPPPV